MADARSTVSTALAARSGRERALDAALDRLVPGRVPDRPDNPDGHVTAEEAVRAYHGDLQREGITPHRSLEEDLVRAPTAQAYGG